MSVKAADVCEAVAASNIIKLKRLLDAGASPDSSIQEGGTLGVDGNPGNLLQGSCELYAIHIAAGTNRRDALKMLLRQGAKRDVAAVYQQTQGADTCLKFLGGASMFFKHGVNMPATVVIA